MKKFMKPVFQLLILDIDGVLTDGTVSVVNDERRLSLRDLDALTRARRAGIEVAFLTGESEASAGPLVKRCGGGHARYDSKGKASALEAMAADAGAPLEIVCYMGDAERDAPALQRAGLGLAPADASQAARKAADRVLAAAGGHGAVEEAVGILLAGADEAAEQPDNRTITDLVSAELAASAAALAKLTDQWGADLARAAAAIAGALASGRRVILCGNGGSAALAQHAAAELVGRFARERRPLPALSLTADSAVTSALGNDFGFERIFERQVEALAQPGDVIIGMSTSGSSGNVARALIAGRRLGALTVALVGANPGPVGDAAETCVYSLRPPPHASRRCTWQLCTPSAGPWKEAQPRNGQGARNRESALGASGGSHGGAAPG